MLNIRNQNREIKSLLDKPEFRYTDYSAHLCSIIPIMLALFVPESADAFNIASLLVLFTHAR